MLYIPRGQRAKNLGVAIHRLPKESAKVSERGVGVSFSMIVIDQDEEETSLSCSAIQVSEDCFATVDCATL